MLDVRSDCAVDDSDVRASASTATATAAPRADNHDHDDEDDHDHDDHGLDDEDDQGRNPDELRRVIVPVPSLQNSSDVARQLVKSFFAAREYLDNRDEWDEDTWEVPAREFETSDPEENLVTLGMNALSQLESAGGHSRWGSSADKVELVNRARMRLALACHEWKSRRHGRTDGGFAKAIGLSKPHKVVAAVQFYRVAEVTPGNAWPFLQITREALSRSSPWRKVIGVYRESVRHFGTSRVS